MPLMNIPIVNAIVFWAYGDAKRFLSSADGKNATIARGDLPVSHVLLASAYAGTINSALVGPVEMVKIQLQAQAAGHTGGHAIGGPLQFMGEAWATAGWRAALHGMAPTIGREILGYAGQFIVYEVRPCRLA